MARSIIAATPVLSMERWPLGEPGHVSEKARMAKMDMIAPPVAIPRHSAGGRIKPQTESEAAMNASVERNQKGIAAAADLCGRVRGRSQL
jgi:hypothetical protein